MKSWKELYDSLLRGAAELVQLRYKQSIDPVQYLYFRPARNGHWGQLCVSPEEPEGRDWELASAEYIPRWMNAKQVIEWINRLQLPVIGDVEEDADGPAPASMQPLYTDADGTIRFKPNKIVQYLLDHGGIDMNHLATVDFPQDDRELFAQLIGYSVCGFHELSYVSDATARKASWAAREIRHDFRACRDLTLDDTN